MEMEVCQHWSENNVWHSEFLLSAFSPEAPRINRTEEEQVFVFGLVGEEKLDSITENYSQPPTNQNL